MKKGSFGGYHMGMIECCDTYDTYLTIFLILDKINGGMGLLSLSLPCHYALAQVLVQVCVGLY
jgi:hypothetical protein